MAASAELTKAVKALAVEAGFARVGIGPASPVAQADRFCEWLRLGCHGSLGYLAKDPARRFHPAAVVEGARSVICLAVGYAPAGPEPTGPFVARYARGRDYHKVLKKKCLRLMDRIPALAGKFSGRAFVDTGPLSERSLAASAGLGWIGRNGCLVAPGLGSYVLLCEVVCNLPLEPDEPLEAGCRDCGACRSACPTGAIREDGRVDCRRCLSALTIEHRGTISPDLAERMGSRVFGCDACQEACPHNRLVPPGDPELAAQGPPLNGASLAEILSWRPEDWDTATRGSAARRATHEMFLRNAAAAAGNLGGRETLAPLRRLNRDGSFPHRALAAWAIERLRARGMGLQT